MRRVIYIGLSVLIYLTGCGNSDHNRLQSDINITEEKDGSIILDLDKAYLLQDSLHPDMNTAEWSFNITSTGRYELWISSFTKDTMDLRYNYPVIVYFKDRNIRANPIGNEIVLNTPDTNGEYYRADSRLGSVYIDEPGNYNIQIVSEKVRPVIDTSEASKTRHTQLQRLILKPMTE